ncbi:outer membrane biogenesis protein BamB [Gimesia alba]|uniref:Outer membrane biogenesis protein BamB n=1 Tax=Gimesia alba TaxID=2527973 RepID=A0A517RNT9_9PLAN|nr:PQQ-binding-like beta-propeller repeat protein [Gimesia alba]QDT45550.1 outer membrane biogenesis protein BamB [Gimesia alba]
MKSVSIFTWLVSVSVLSVLTGCSDSSVVALNDDTPQPKPLEMDRAISGVKEETTATPATEISTTNAVYNWPCWRGPDGTGISRETGLLHVFPESGPTILWQAKLGTGFSGLSIADGRLITLFGESGREIIVCFDANSGRKIWTVDSDADFAQGRSFGPRATPWIDGDRVYVVGASGMIFCLEVATGNKIWSFNIYDQFAMQQFVHEEGLSCSPVILENKLILLAGNSAFAFDKQNGELIWRACREKMNHTTPRVAYMERRSQLLVLTAENLISLDPQTGEEFWRHPQQAVNCASPVVGPDNQVFTAAAYGFGSQLVKLTGNSATQVYQNKELATHHATAVLFEGHLFGFHDRPGIFKCVAFHTGKEKWSSRSPGKGKLIIADGQMIIITETGELVLAPVSSDGFHPASQARVLKGTCYTAPALANGRLYVRSNQQLVCIDMKK